MRLVQHNSAAAGRNKTNWFNCLEIYDGAFYKGKLVECRYIYAKTREKKRTARPSVSARCGDMVEAKQISTVKCSRPKRW